MPPKQNTLFSQTLAAVLFLISANASFAAPEEQELSIDQARPVGQAVMELMKRHGIWVSYEDPRYEYEADLADVGPLVRKDAGKAASDRVPKVLVPAAGVISLRYAVSADTHSPPDARGLIQKVIDLHNGGESLGHFRLIDHGKYLEVVPDRVRDHQGTWRTGTSLLDARISIPAAERTTYETLDVFCRTLSERVGVEVVVGAVPLKLMLSTKQSLGVQDTAARTVLLQIIDATETKLAWFLFYDPGMHFYALNLLPVPTTEPKGANVPPVPPAHGSPPVMPGARR